MKVCNSKLLNLSFTRNWSEKPFSIWKNYILFYYWFAILQNIWLRRVVESVFNAVITKNADVTKNSYIFCKHSWWYMVFRDRSFSQSEVEVGGKPQPPTSCLLPPPPKKKNKKTEVQNPPRIGLKAKSKKVTSVMRQVINKHFEKDK